MSVTTDLTRDDRVDEEDVISNGIAASSQQEQAVTPLITKLSSGTLAESLGSTFRHRNINGLGESLSSDTRRSLNSGNITGRGGLTNRGPNGSGVASKLGVTVGISRNSTTPSITPVRSSERNYSCLGDGAANSHLNSFKKRFHDSFLSSRGVLDEEVQDDIKRKRHFLTQISSTMDGSNPTETSLMHIAEELLESVVEGELIMETRMNEAYCLEDIMRKTIADQHISVNRLTAENEVLHDKVDSLKMKFKAVVTLLSNLPRGDIFGFQRNPHNSVLLPVRDGGRQINGATLGMMRPSDAQGIA